MKSSWLCALVFCFGWCSNGVLAQQYFKLFEKGGRPYEQKIARFSNGDILIGGSPLTGETSDQNGGLNLTRLDACGNVRWAMNYQWKKNYMKFKDVEINEAQEIFIYGTAYESPNSEFIFLLKLNNKGNVLAFRVYHGGTVDNFTYNITLYHDRILAYGLLLDWNTPKRGFVAVFDDKLNYQWAKVFEPFESVGEAIVTADNGFLCRSGFYLMKLNAQGEQEWASTLEAQEGTGLYPIAGPLAIKDGYILEAVYDKYAFFYKIDYHGRLSWKSAQFPATNQAADISLLPDGNVLATYNCPGEGENYPCQLLLSPDGAILQQKKLLINQTLHTAAIYHSVAKNRTVNIIGTKDVLAGDLDGPTGFLMQFPLDSLSGKCFQWESFQNTLPNQATFVFTPLALSYFNAAFRNVEASISPSKLEYSFEESCDLSATHLIQLDSVLTCGENWQVRLPSADFKWEDEEPDNPRILERPGIYRASNKDCISPRSYEFNLQRAPCLCNVFLPTAFSPNYDGQNDRLELFSNCKLQEVQMSIYDRWGDKIFSSNAADAHWDGSMKQKRADAGIYVAVVRYQLLNDNNEIQEGSLVQNITLVR